MQSARDIAEAVVLAWLVEDCDRDPATQPVLDALTRRIVDALETQAMRLRAPAREQAVPLPPPILQEEQRVPSLRGGRPAHLTPCPKLEGVHVPQRLWEDLWASLLSAGMTARIQLRHAEANMIGWALQDLERLAPAVDTRAA